MGQVCFQNACCNSPTCPAGNMGDKCGVISACGQMTGNCACTQMYMTCGAVTAGICGCKPLDQSCCGGNGCHAGSNPDGCGGFVNCMN
jgi:hypothetical protein